MTRWREGLRRRGWLIVAFAVAGMATFGIASSLRPAVYESTATVRLGRIWIPSFYQTPDLATDPERDMVREVAHVRADLIDNGIETQFAYDMTIDAEPGDEPRELVFVGTSWDPGYAENVPRTAVATYLDIRESEARGHADAAVSFWEDQVTSLQEQVVAGEPVESELTAAEQQLEGAEARAADVSDHAELVEGPTAAANHSPRPLLAAALGGVAGLLIGLAVALALERSPRLLRRDDDVAGAEAESASWAEAPRIAFLILGALVVGRAAIYAAYGANYILDDWSLIGYREFLGVADLVPVGNDLIRARPGAWLTFTLFYGAVGPHPLILLAVLTALNVGLAILVYLVLARFLSRPIALFVAALWVVLPTHNSITVWTGTAQVAVGLLLFVLGMLALTHGRWLLAGLALAASILCYELTTPACLLAPLIVGTPLLPVRPEAVTRGLAWWQRLIATAMAAAAAIWAAAHALHPLELRGPSVKSIWTSHFGVGLYGSTAASNWLVALTAGLVAGAVAFALVRWLAGDRGRNAGPTLVVAGVVVMGVGLGVSFSFAIYPLGFGDRLFAVSSIGSALVLAGVLRMVWEHSRTIAVTGAVGLTAIAVTGQVVSLRSWSQAGDDVVAALHYIDTAVPNPESTHFIVGPAFINRNGVIGASSPYGGADMAYRLKYPDGTGSMVFANNADEFVSTEGQVLVEWPDVLAAP